MSLILQFRKRSLIQHLQTEALAVLCDAVSGTVQKMNLLYPAAQILNTLLWLVIQKVRLYIRQ